MQGVCEVQRKEVDLDKELELVAEKLELIKRSKSGFGRIEIQVANRRMSNIKMEISEQVKSK